MTTREKHLTAEIERCHLALRCRDEAPLWRVVWHWALAQLPIRGGR